MDDMWTRVADQLVARITGPMKFRLVLQPAMAAFFAIHAGLADARAGRPPYFWGMISNPDQCVAMMKDGWKSVGRVLILTVVLDVVYQIIELRFIYIGEAIIVAFILAILPYLILRGLVTRLARRNHVPLPPGQPTPSAGLADKDERRPDLSLSTGRPSSAAGVDAGIVSHRFALMHYRLLKHRRNK
jgi:hypothetical protein